jgi:copper/silver efflux system protein
MIEKLIEFSARNRFFVFLFLTFALAWGIWALVGIPLDAIPDLSDVQVIVFTEWPGRSPDLVEDQITYPIVSAMLAAPRVEVVRGISDFGFSYVYIIFDEGTDLYWARSRVLEYLQAIAGTLPDAATPKLAPDATAVGWVFQYALVDETGQYNLAQLRSFQDWYLRYWLESVPGIAEVAAIGGFVKQYQVVLDPNKLLAYNIPLNHVVRAIQRSNREVGGRILEVAAREHMVRGRGYIRSLEDVETIPVATDARGTPVHIRDLGHVQFGPDMRRGVAELDGKGEVVGGIVIMRYGENALDVINNVKRRIAEVEDSLPPGVKLVVTYDRSELILRAIDTLVEILTKEMLIVSVIIIVFLLHFRTALIVILTLPIAVLLSFIPMYYMGLTANIMSIGGIAIAIGTMVDAAIVLVEQAHKNLDQWEKDGRPGDRFDVIVTSFKEVGTTIFFTLLVITVSFLPGLHPDRPGGTDVSSPGLHQDLLHVVRRHFGRHSGSGPGLLPDSRADSIRGPPSHQPPSPGALPAVARSRRALPQAVHCRRRPDHGGQRPPLPAVGLRVHAAAERGLHSLYAHGGSGNAGGRGRPHPSDPGPHPDGVPRSGARLRQGRTGRHRHRPRPFEHGGNHHPPQTAGRVGSRQRGTVAFESGARIYETGPEPALARGASKVLGGTGLRNGSEAPFPGHAQRLVDARPNPHRDAHHGHSEQPRDQGVRARAETIGEIANRIEHVLQDLPGTRSVFADRVLGGSYLDFEVSRHEAARYGLTMDDVNEIIETAIGGRNIGQTVEGRERYPINVRYPRELRDDIEVLTRVLVPTPTGAQVPIALLADIRYSDGPPMIRNEDGQLVGFVFVDVTDGDYGGYVRRAQEVVRAEVELPPGYRLDWAGQYRYMERMNERLRYIIPMTLFIVFILLYLNFGSWQECAIVFLGVPFSVVGAFWLLWAWITT